MAGTIATRIAVLDAIKKLQEKKTPWPKIVKHLNKNGLHPGSRRRWTYSAALKYWMKYKHLLEQKTKTQATRDLKRIELLGKRYPRHQILSHDKMVQEIKALRWNEDGEWGWDSVAQQLNKRRILHEAWRGHSSKWNKDSLRIYFKRRGSEKTTALLERSTDALFEKKTETLNTPKGMGKAASDCTRKVEINFQELSNEHQLSGTIRMGTDKDTSTVRFTYEGEVTPAAQDFLRSFQLLP